MATYQNMMVGRAARRQLGAFEAEGASNGAGPDLLLKSPTDTLLEFGCLAVATGG
jgi:hypothetical protein